jgi:hypothetical protein
VERTAFLVVAEAIRAAGERGSSRVAVRIARHGDRLRVEVDGAGPGPFPDTVDRVGALGGRLDVEVARLRAEIPCA